MPLYLLMRVYGRLENPALNQQDVGSKHVNLWKRSAAEALEEMLELGLPEVRCKR